MKRILVVCSGYPPDIRGGGEEFTQVLAQGLSANGHEVRVLAAADEDGERLDSDGKTHIKRVRSSNIYWNFKGSPSLLKKCVWHLLDNYNPMAIRVVEKYVQEIKPDLIISSTIENFGPAAWQAGSRSGTPVIHVLRSYYALCYKGTMFSSGRNCDGQCLKCSLLTLGRRYATRHVDGVVGISRFILNQHQALFRQALPIVIPNPVRPTAARNKPRQTRDLVTFGFLGRIEPEKGIAEVLEAFQRLPENLHLVIAGRGKPDYEAQLRQKFASERIRFIGWVDANPVYSMIDFALVPSLWNEPFCRVVIEAFSHGVPVVTSTRGGLPEIVHDGRLGYLYDPLNPDGLRNACRRAASEIASYDEMSAAVVEETLRYRPAEIASQYEKLFDQISRRADARQAG